MGETRTILLTLQRWRAGPAKHSQDELNNSGRSCSQETAGAVRARRPQEFEVWKGADHRKLGGIHKAVQLSNSESFAQRRRGGSSGMNGRSHVNRSAR